jgi:hypothetical protein
MSPGLAAMNDLAAAAGPFAGAARLLEKLAGVRLTARRVERAAEASGTALAAAGREGARLIASRKVVPLPPSPLPDKLYAAIDGTGVPMTAKETAGRRGKARTAAPAPARSSSPSSSPRTSSTLTATPSATGPPRASSRLSSPRRSGTWSGPRASAAARTTSASSPSSATAPPGTSPPKFPEATQIVDLYQAREHLHCLTRSLEFMLGDRRDEWLAARLEDLDYGGINGIEAAVREYPRRRNQERRSRQGTRLLPQQRPRMRYRWFRSRGLFVGSGVVEASRKTIPVGQRLKQAGMHWTVAGADAIIALRCKEASSQREAICNHRHNQTGAA